MPQEDTKITLICDAPVEEAIENAITNSGIQFTKEKVTEPIEAFVFHMPYIPSLVFHVLHIIEAKKDVVKGNIELPDKTKYELTQEGIIQLNGFLIEDMSKKKENVPSPIAWWVPFIPEIREGLRAFIDILKWYPKATGEGKKTVVTYFVVLMGMVVLGMGVLTYFDKVSGDSFVFVIGALIGYIFAFLQRFLGILSE
jgi:hypothetical protein